MVQCDDCSCWIHVTCTDLEYSELSTSTKFSCIECTNTAKVSFIYDIAYCYISAVDTNNAWCHGNHS